MADRREPSFAGVPDYGGEPVGGNGPITAVNAWPAILSDGSDGSDGSGRGDNSVKMDEYGGQLPGAALYSGPASFQGGPIPAGRLHGASSSGEEGGLADGATVAHL